MTIAIPASPSLPKAHDVITCSLDRKPRLPMNPQLRARARQLERKITARGRERSNEDQGG
jgi:hypothetical protein